MKENGQSDWKKKERKKEEKKKPKMSFSLVEKWVFGEALKLSLGPAF